MTNAGYDELVRLTNRPDLAEVGGAHNNKGGEFQRHWALTKMIQLEDDGAPDYLILFEAIQDVAILDSATTPTSVAIYQVKKRERREWAWLDLTALHPPKHPRKTRRTSNRTRPKPNSEVASSPVGKLYAAVLAVAELRATGHFVSNAGCDIPLADGTNAATSQPSDLSKLSPSFVTLLSDALLTLHQQGDPPPDLSRLYIEKVAVPADEPGTFVAGAVHNFLLRRSPRHAGQARSLVDALLAKIGPLGARTDNCSTPEQLRERHGFSKAQLASALAHLHNVPDLLSHFETWLARLNQEGMGFLEITAMRAAAAGIYQRQVAGTRSQDEERFIADCDVWLASHADPTNLKPYFDAAYDDLAVRHQRLRKPELLAHFALRAIQKCVDQT